LFYTLEKSWTSAKDLELGDTVVTLSGEKYKIETIYKDCYDGIIVVYNFEVEDNHNYYVGDNKVLVHNDGCTVSDKGSSGGGTNAGVGNGNPRYKKGVVSGSENLYNIDKMMRGKQGNIGIIPKEIGDKIQGRTFNNFDEFREALWTEIGNRTLMKKGNAPFAIPEQWSGKTGKYAIHHKTPIHDGGGVYDLNNILITTPRMHLDILDRNYHFNK
jgi:hypothetical protein